MYTRRHPQITRFNIRTSAFYYIPIFCSNLRRLLNFSRPLATFANNVPINIYRRDILTNGQTGIRERIRLLNSPTDDTGLDYRHPHVSRHTHPIIKLNRTNERPESDLNTDMPPVFIKRNMSQFCSSNVVIVDIHCLATHSDQSQHVLPSAIDFTCALVLDFSS